MVWLLVSMGLPVGPQELFSAPVTCTEAESPFCHVGNQIPTQEVFQWITRSLKPETIGNGGQDSGWRGEGGIQPGH